MWLVVVTCIIFPWDSFPLRLTLVWVKERFRFAGSELLLGMCAAQLVVWLLKLEHTGEVEVA